MGFFGRDETLLALDRAFDDHSIVLLHGFAGSGKTATAAEFARWYALTGGLEGGPVLFTSFEHHRPLSRVLDEIGRVFGDALERGGTNWSAITETSERRHVALEVLTQAPVLWIWDNVEPVTGFPAGTESAWSRAEQDELADFLRDARETKAKFLLTSRRDEKGWLVELPARVSVPPMPMQERVQLARALAEKRGRRLADVDDWRPLLRFTHGNPLTVTVLVGQALRDGLSTSDQIKNFVARLRAGEAAFEDEESEGRSKSLGASLNYGFEHGFSEEGRRVLALLHLFQGFVDVDVLRIMGSPEAEWGLEEVRGLTREVGIELLDRAAEVGLLTAAGRGYYTIHPALPWFFKGLYDEHYAGSGKGLTGVRSFVEAMGLLGNYYFEQYEEGNRDVIRPLTAEEANLLYALRSARTHGWRPGVIMAMQGLRDLYGHTGRRAEWSRLVNEIIDDFVDPNTDGPLPGGEEEWSVVTEYRVHLQQYARQWGEAERLQRLLVDWGRRGASSALAAPPETLDSEQRGTIRSDSVSLELLGHIHREQGKSECVTAYEESIAMFQSVGDAHAEAVVAFNVGHAYKDIPEIRDLAQAEQWYQRSLGCTTTATVWGEVNVTTNWGMWP